MLADIWLLMNLYWKIDRRGITGSSRWQILGFIAGMIGILFVGATAAAVGYFSSYLIRPEMPVRVPPGLIPGLMLTFFLLGVLITGLGQSVKALFLSGDLDRLMVAPVHTRSVMVAKLLSRMPTNILFMLLIAIPALVAYGIGIGAGPVYYVLGAVLLLLAPLFGLSVGALIAMLLVRVLPVKRLNELMAATYALFGIVFALLAQLPRLFINEDTEQMMESVSGRTITATAETLNSLPIPSILAGRGLVALDAGQADLVGLAGIGAYLLTTLGLFILIIFTADRLYLSGWLKTQSVGGKRKSLDTKDGRFGNGSLARSIALKDWLTRVRDPRQLVSLVGSGFIAVVVGALALFRGGTGSDESLMTAATQGDLTIPGQFGVGFSPGVILAVWALFVAYVFLSNTATYALALEGLSFPMLKAAPVLPGEVWMAKFWSVFVPFAVFFALVLIGSRLLMSYSLAWLPYALVAGLIMGVGLLSSSISIGFRYANLSWTDPRRMISTGGGWVSLIFWVAYAIPIGLIVLLGFFLGLIWPSWAIPLAAAALLVAGLLTWGFFVLMQRWGESAWEKLPV